MSALDRHFRATVARKSGHVSALASASGYRGYPRHRRARGFWWSILRATCRSLARRFFSRTGAMLVSAHDGGVDHHVLVVVIAGQKLENTIEKPRSSPIGRNVDGPISNGRNAQVNPATDTQS